MALTTTNIDDLLYSYPSTIYKSTLNTFIAACNNTTDNTANTAANTMLTTSSLWSGSILGDGWSTAYITSGLLSALAAHPLISNTALMNIAQNTNVSAVLTAIIARPGVAADILVAILGNSAATATEVTGIYNNNVLSHTMLGELAANPNATLTQINNIATDIISDLSNGIVSPSALLHYKNSIGKFTEPQQAQLIQHVLSCNDYAVAANMSTTSRANIGKLILKQS